MVTMECAARPRSVAVGSSTAISLPDSSCVFSLSLLISVTLPLMRGTSQPNIGHNTSSELSRVACRSPVHELVAISRASQDVVISRGSDGTLLPYRFLKTTRKTGLTLAICRARPLRNLSKASTSFQNGTSMAHPPVKHPATIPMSTFVPSRCSPILSV